MLYIRKFIKIYYLNNHANCDPRNGAYKNGKTFEDCKVEARDLVTRLSGETHDNEEISWKHILEIANHDVEGTECEVYLAGNIYGDCTLQLATDSLLCQQLLES